MHHTPHEDRGDLLSSVADLLDTIGNDAGSRSDRSRFCRDASEWVRGVREEMEQLLNEFQRGIQQAQAVRTTADAAGRIAGRATSLAMHAGQDGEGNEPGAPHEARIGVDAAAGGDDPPRVSSGMDHGRSGSPSHVEQAESIRADVASFREQLRAERAERARKAADERRRFVESLRRGTTPNGDTASNPSGKPPARPSDQPAADEPAATAEPPRSSEHQSPTAGDPNAAVEPNDESGASIPVSLGRDDSGGRLEPPRFRQQPITPGIGPATTDGDAETENESGRASASAGDVRATVSTVVVGSLTDVCLPLGPIATAPFGSRQAGQPIERASSAPQQGETVRRVDVTPEDPPAAEAPAVSAAMPSASTQRDGPAHAAAYRSPFRRTDGRSDTGPGQAIRFRMKPAG